MTNPTIINDAPAPIQNTSNEFHDDNYILGLISRMSPIFKCLFFSAMSIRHGNLKPANDATFTHGLIHNAVSTELLENKNPQT